MPCFNGRGPWSGTGPGTGWGMGPCGAGRGRGFRRTAFFGRGPGFGRGFGAGWENSWGAASYAPYPGAYPSMDPADEKAALEDEMNALEAHLKEVRNRLDSIGKES